MAFERRSKNPLAVNLAAKYPAKVLACLSGVTAAKGRRRRRTATTTTKMRVEPSLPKQSYFRLLEVWPDPSTRYYTTSLL